MADKTYKLKFHLSNGTVKEVEFTAPQGPQGDPFTYEDFTAEQLKGLKGPDGKSAYEYAKEAGYEGSEEAFAKALSSGSGFQVGDILTTVRTDLGEKWLLCNGEQVSAEDYSKLADLIPNNPDFVSENFSIDGLATVNCITYANGYWVVGGKYNSYARIAYATDLAGPWTTKDIWSGTNTTTINCIAYADGKWVVGGRAYNSSTYYARIACATDLTGSWTTMDIASQSFGIGNSELTAVTAVAYANGYWVVGYKSAMYTYIGYTTDLAGAWTEKRLLGNYSRENINCITYANGYWVVGGRCWAGAGAILYTTDLAGSWTTEYIFEGDSSTIVNCITYADGYWVVGGTYYESGTYFGEIAYATDLAGEWTTKDIWSNTDSDYSATISNVAYANGFWLVGGRPSGRIACATDLAGEWTTKDLQIGNGSVKGVINVNGKWAVCTGGVINYGDCGFFFALPAVSTDGAYNYIKALEG